MNNFEWSGRLAEFLPVKIALEQAAEPSEIISDNIQTAQPEAVLFCEIQITKSLIYNLRLF
ncbi:hypothetical protein [Dryocola sp. BD613]|uniref:hypothetical protein n=1 Tax=Dryocola sp. BD613 TaxID=3133272 RepID=UPI003F50A731